MTGPQRDVGQDPRKFAEHFRWKWILLFSGLFVFLLVACGRAEQKAATPGPSGAVPLTGPAPTGAPSATAPDLVESPPPAATQSATPESSSVPAAETAEPGGLVCVTGVAVPKEKAIAANASEIGQAFQSIKEGLGINIVWQLFDRASTESDWIAYFDEARVQGVKVLAANTEADNYQPTCASNADCELGPVEPFLRSIANHPEVYGGVLYGVLLLDEPYEDINADQLRSLYQKGKEIAPETPLVVGWSRELWRFQRPGLGFSDGMCDICLISGLEVRNGVLNEETLRANHKTSRDLISREDPDARILSSLPVFGSPGSRAGYSMPDPPLLQKLVDIVLSPEYGRLDGLMWQSWEAPTLQKAESQDTLGQPEFEAQRKVVRAVCGTG